MRILVTGASGFAGTARLIEACLGVTGEGARFPRLRELGWSPRFATVREGVADAVARLRGIA